MMLIRWHDMLLLLHSVDPYCDHFISQNHFIPRFILLAYIQNISFLSKKCSIIVLSSKQTSIDIAIDDKPIKL